MAITHDFQADIDCKRGNAITIIDVGNFAGTICERMISNLISSMLGRKTDIIERKVDPE